MRMVCMLGMVAVPLPVSKKWKSSTRVTVVVNETSFVDSGTFLRTVEIIHKDRGEGKVDSEDGLGTAARPEESRWVIFLFILWGMFMNAGCRGLTAIIMVALRIGI